MKLQLLDLTITTDLVISVYFAPQKQSAGFALSAFFIGGVWKNRGNQCLVVPCR